MSSNIYKIQIISERGKALSTELTDALKSCVASDKQVRKSPTLLAVFQPWVDAFLISVADLGEGIEFVLDCSSTYMWSVDILDALVRRGASFVAVEAYYDQVDAEQVFYYKGLERISENDFPTIEYGGLEKEIQALLEKGKDKELVNRVKDGLNPNLVIDGDPLLKWSIDCYLDKLPYALLEAGGNFKVAVSKGKGSSVFSTILCRSGDDGRARLIEALVNDGFDLNVKDSSESPLACVASEAASNEDCFPLLDLILQLGADVNDHVWHVEGKPKPGNLLFNTRLYQGEYQQQVYERLVAAGAKVIPASSLSNEEKVQRLLDREPTAETVEDLAATGFDFNLEVDGKPFIFAALSIDLKLALQVIDHIDAKRLIDNSPARLLCQICQCVKYNEGNIADAEEVIRRFEKAGLKPNGHAIDSEYQANIFDYFSLHSLPDRPMRAGQSPYLISDLVKALGLDEYRWA